MTNPWKRRVEIGEVVLYEGDCLEIMPTLGKVDAVVIDPITPRTPFLPVLHLIAEAYGVTLDEVKGRGRREDRVRARWHVMHYLRTVRRWSYPRIGQYLDGRDHSTVIHGVREHERLHAKPECD